MARHTKLASLLSQGFDEEATRYDEAVDPGRVPMFPDGRVPREENKPEGMSFEEKLAPDTIPNGTRPGRPLAASKASKKRARNLDNIEYPAEASHNPNGYTTAANLNRESNGSGERPRTRKRRKTTKGD